MQDLADYFVPVDIADFEARYATIPQSLGNIVDIHTLEFPDWRQADLVLAGATEDRGGRGRPGAAQAPDRIRQYLYQLAAPLTSIKIADLGNFRHQEDLSELYDDIADVTEALLKAGKTFILLGGTQDITFGQYLGFEHLETMVEYVTIDSSPDILDPAEGIHHHSHNNAILTFSPNYLAHFSNLAAQNYFISEGERKAMSSLFFDTLRVGEINANVRLAEPFLRTAHLVSFDVSAVRHSEAPGTNHPSPAGLSVEHACTLARYAGMGYHCQAINFCEVNPEQDVRNMTSHLTALLVWHFIEGLYNRVMDQPKADRSNLKKYIAHLNGPVSQIVFWKSEHTNRWWMEVPSVEAKKSNLLRVAMIPCAEADYLTAMNDEVPDRWWATHYRYQ
jgi:arginase family enzyme